LSKITQIDADYRFNCNDHGLVKTGFVTQRRKDAKFFLGGFAPLHEINSEQLLTLTDFRFNLRNL
jgi:hypothetical protein